MNIATTNAPYRFIAAIGFSCAVSLGLLAARVIDSDSARYIFLLWNLLLAVIPVPLGWWLVQRIRLFGWLHWQQILLTLLWLSFLPNSFYLVTDFIHLRETYEASLIFDVMLLASFMCNGFILGFLSVYMIHKELIRRMSELKAYGIVALILLACSFAAYLGRFTRWNTWDLLLRPAGLLFDVSDRIINPAAHTQTYVATVTLFLLLLGVYVVIWEGTLLLRRK
jgi:uncharacterized membrane protein